MSWTSAVTYKAAQESGYISDRCWQVYDYLYHHGPSTAWEIFIGLGWTSGTTHPRLIDLEFQGVVMRLPDKKLHSGPFQTPAIVWATTDALPRKLSKRVGPKEKLHTLIEAITEAEDLKELQVFVRDCIEEWGD